jgi:iron complex outermembrane receptor protein
MVYSFPRRLAAALALAALAPAGAIAQRADENAVTAADDAFGTTVGSQSIGLYDIEHVRGFSPRAAGNLRIEGLYFDEQTYATNRCLFVEQTVRVGLAAQFFDTPSPTGIANLSLHASGPANGASVVIARGPFLQSRLELDGQRAARSGAASAGLCFHALSNFDTDLAHRSHGFETGAVGQWRPSAQVEVLHFWGLSKGDEHDELPTVYINGTDRPPEFIEARLPTQRWARWHWNEITAGTLARSTGEGAWSWAGGVFLSTERSPPNYSDLFDEFAADGTVHHELDVTPPSHARSTSGEFRLLHRSVAGKRQRLWSIALRGRNLSRSFGGDFFHDYSAELGPQRIDEWLALPAPQLVFGDGSEDRARQLGLGLSFEQRWTDRGSLSIGVQKVDYRRSIAAPSATTHEHSTPTLLNLRFTRNLAPTLVSYAGYTRGLEDSALAPSNAGNAFATAPATATWQVDAGVRMTPSQSLQLVAGVFEIQKAYFNLDRLGIYRQLGHIRHSGVEASAAVNGADGFTAVLGGVWLRPSVLPAAGEPDPGGSAATGTTPLVLDANLDYAPRRWGAWSAGAQLHHVSSRPAGQAWLPAYYLFSLSVRYRLELYGRTCLVRMDAEDLNNATDLYLSSTGLALSEEGRRVALTLTMDF